MEWNRTCALSLVAAIVLWTGGATVSADERDQATHPAEASEPAETASGLERDPRIRFNFKGATFDQVLDFFSRETGLPVVKQADVPDGTLDYLSPERYDLPEALRVLNIILHARGVMLQVSNDMLFLRRLDQAQRADLPTFVGAVPADVTDDRLVTVVKPLNIALAKPLAERLAEMVGTYGAVAALEQQNSIIITETAAQARRLLKIIEELDREDPEGAIEIFRIEHAKVADLMVPLKALLTVRVERYVINQQGQQVKTEEEQMPGLSISADDRTNSIVAKGTPARIENLRQAIALLDVPASVGGRAIRTITLGVLSPRDAARRLNEVYNRLPADDRPVVLSLDDFGQVTIVGADAVIAEGVALLEEIDGGSAANGDAGVRMTVVMLEHGEPEGIIRALRSLLNSRQLASTRLVAGPDARSIIVAGSDSDVGTVESVIPTLDRPARIDRGLRLLTISPQTTDPQGIFERCVHLYGMQVEGRGPELVVDAAFDEESRTITAIGSPAALDEFATVLRSIEGTILQRETRQVVCRHVPPSELASAIATVVESRATADGSRQPPLIEAFDELDLLLITATTEQHQILTPLIQSMDVAKERPVRVLWVERADARELAANLQAIFADAGPHERAGLPPVIRVDHASNSLLVRASDSQFETIEDLVSRIDRATFTASRPMQLIQIDPSKATAAEVAQTLQRLIEGAGGSKVEVITLEELLREKSDPRIQTSTDDDGAEDVGWAPSGGNCLSDAQAQETRAVLNPARLRRSVVSLTMLFSFAPVRDGSDPAVTIAVDEATNSLIVIGAPRLVDRVASMAREVQDQMPAAPPTVRHVALPDGVDANSLSHLLSHTLWQMTPPGGRRGEFMSQGRITIVPDTNGNALIITCNDRDFSTVAELLAAVSREPATQEVLVKVYRLQTINAERAASSVRSLITPDQQLRGARRGRQEQRMRNVAMTLLAEGQTIEAIFDPEQIRVNADQHSNSLIVMGPAPAIGFIDQYIELLDQAPMTSGNQATLKLYPLRHARAHELRNTLRGLFQSRFRSMRDRTGAVEPEFAVDNRTNTLIVTASPEHLAEIDSLLSDLDQKLGEDVHPLRTIELAAALPGRAADILRQVVLGADQQRVASTMIVADDNSGMLLVRASDEVNEEIDQVLREIDRDAASEFEVRTIVLERANAQAVASAIQRFYDDRARIASAARGRRDQPRRISIVGDQASRTLLVAASDTDFEQIKQLVEQFDSPAATSALTFRVFELRHARATEITETVQNLVDDLMWNQSGMWFWPPRPQPQRDQGTIAVRADARLNVLIVTGEGDRFEVVEQLIDLLDAPVADHAQRQVRLYRIQHAQTSVVADVVIELFGDGGRSQRRWWLPPDPSVVNVRIDDPTKTLIISASAREHEEIADLIAGIDEQVQTAEHETKVFALEFAQAGEIANTLRQFLSDRARATNAPAPSATILASPSANSLVVSAGGDDLLTVQDLVGKLDQPDVSGDRTIEVMALQQAQSHEIARIIREQFPRPRSGQGVTVTSDARTNSLIVNAPQKQAGEVKALIDRLDSPPASDETIIRTYALDGARADEAQRLLSQTLQLDDRGRTPGRGITIRLEDDEAHPVEVKARIVADRRSNTLIVTATAESFPVIESLIKKIDDVPAANPIEYRIIALEHALADDVAFTLRMVARALPTVPGEPTPRIDWNRFENQLIIAATADQFEQLTKIVNEIDQPSKRQRVTDFVPLQFAEAQQVQEALSVFYGPFALEADTPGKRNVRIVADPATNSLVISADETEWEGIRGLLAELDSEEYDSSLQLRVFPLTYADSRSVARAINEAFAGTIERGRATRGADQRQSRARRTGEEDRRDDMTPTLLVESEEWIRASAEPLTNSLIVSASRQHLHKIEQIIEQLDVADFAKLPPPQLIPVTTGDPARLAESLKALYEQSTPGADRARGGKGLVIVGDATSNTIIVRAEEEEFRQINALAEALQQEATQQGMSVHVLRLTSAPAARVASAIRDAYQAKARQTNQPLSIQVDAQGNSLVIASTGGLFREIEETVKQLDALSPGANQSIFIIELENISPEAARSVIETIGLHQRQPEDSVSRLVSEPIKVSVLRDRNALVIVASPADRETIVALLKAVDAEPQLAEAQMRIVRLRNADANSVGRILGEVLSPSNQQVQTPLARAIQEQIRRLAVRRDGLNEHDLHLDLTKPIRVMPDPRMNAIVIASTEANVRAMEHVIGMFDQLPITDAVTVQIFPLANISAEQFSRIVRDLFTQGRQLGSVPGAPGMPVPAMPAGMVGKALLEHIAITTDERTNTVIVAGKEDSVALVEVLVKRLDSDISGGWVEPRILQLRFADAGDLSRTLQSVLVEGATALPQASPLQRQIGRLRLARQEEDGGRVLESDVFQPMTRLVIRPEPQLNALILVGTPVNLEVVTELVRMLDIEAASPSAAVRIYPVEHASAARLASTITRLFDQQVQSKAIREEDRVIVQAEERTNSLIVTTSPRSFAVLESLLKTLDAEIAPDLREIRRVELRHASATRLAGLVQQLMDARLERLRRVQPETADLERATVVADPRTNSLIVAAGNESFEVIKRLARDLDTSTLGDMSLVHVLAVPKGNVERIAQAINEVMQRRYADQPAEIRASQRPLVMTDPRSNSLLVAANPEDLAAIQDLVVKLANAPTNPAIGLHVVSIDGSVRCEQLAPRIQRLMAERQQSLGEARTPSDRVSIEPDPATNSLIIAATEENLDVIRGLIDVLIHADSSAGREVELIMLSGASRAPEMVSLLNELHVREANRARGDHTVRITADERLNAVLVNAPAPDVQIIKGLVARLDSAKPTTVIETRFITLQSANAREVVSLIENVLSGRGIGARAGSRQSTVLKYVREIVQAHGENIPIDQDNPEEFAAEMHVGAAIRESITLTPDVRTNTVIVSAPRDSMRMIERMVRDLDASSSGSQSIRIFKLTNADALAMAQILTDLFSLQRQGNIFVLRPREAPGAALDGPVDGETFAATGLSGTELTAVPDERQQLSITVDSRTNSLLVSGTPTYLDLVENVIKELDSQEANERDVFVYQLRNAVAGEVARVLGEFVEQEQRKLVSTLGTDQLGSAARLLEREITIVGDEKSNTVLVSASPRYMERVREMIDRLDVDPPQVLIQVLLAEVTLDSTDEWGVDMQAVGRAGSFAISGGFGLASAFVTGMGVPNIAIASSDFDLLIRALQAQGRLQVLSNPSVMAANNEAARIQIGETVRLPTQINVSEFGSVQTSVEAQEIGVILEVTPSINPDGFVRMAIRPEISNVSARTTQISPDFEAPIIIKREAQTTVTVFDGQTIVLGGLISDRFERRDRKVPLLGDIPLLGMLFRQFTEENAKTELLIVLTPHVIESPAELRRVQELTEREIDRLSLPDDVKRSIRETGTDMRGGVFDSDGRLIEIGHAEDSE